MRGGGLGEGEEVEAGKLLGEEGRGKGANRCVERVLAGEEVGRRERRSSAAKRRTGWGGMRRRQGRARGRLGKLEAGGLTVGRLVLLRMLLLLRMRMLSMLCVLLLLVLLGETRALELGLGPEGDGGPGVEGRGGGGGGGGSGSGNGGQEAGGPREKAHQHGGRLVGHHSSRSNRRRPSLPAAAVGEKVLSVVS